MPLCSMREWDSDRERSAVLLSAPPLPIRRDAGARQKCDFGG